MKYEQYEQHEQYENDAALDNNNETWEKELSLDDLKEINGGILPIGVGLELGLGLNIG